jgi:diaminopimelate decarboxylase/aspartate kinase
MTTSPFDKWIVLKFGGTSVASRACWDTIAKIARERIDAGLRPIIVCSACAGISDQLERLLAAAIAGGHDEILRGIETRHCELARDLGIDLGDAEGHLEDLRRLITGAALVREASPRVHAQSMAAGELMSTRIGAAFLHAQGVKASWQDARMCLAAEERSTNQRRHYLHATCNCDPDQACQERFSDASFDAVITQGFIASDANGDTVLLGRGGSDVSAAYFAAKLGAARCEIWTDVPGMYTANPRQVPTARLLTSLDYDEAQEIATTGAKVLHPRCIDPVRKAGIPLSIHCLAHPHMEGTVVSPAAYKTGPQVKAISAKRGVTIVSMESIDMWHQAGFLADVFTRFKDHGFSIDLVSTSETNVTVTLDRATNVYDDHTIKALVSDLETFCHVRVIENGAMVSLVGRNIRSVFHQLGSALEVFAEQKIHLITQAANDLNLIFVVDEEQAERLMRELHGQIFGQRVRDELLGPSWKELFEKDEDEKSAHRRSWWHDRRGELIALAGKHSPLYVYDEKTIERSIENLTRLEAVDRVFYSIKANAYSAILRKVHDAGLGFECVSAGEVEHLFTQFPRLDPERVLFTPNFVPRAEYEYALERGVHVTLDNLFPLERWPKLFCGREIFVRMDPGMGRGHHKYVHTAGTKTKFGVPSFQLDELERLVKASSARVVGLHAHGGSNIFQTDTWGEAALYLSEVAGRFPDVRYIDMGGGLGVVEKPGQGELDLHAVDEHLRKVKTAHPGRELWIEPGRYIVAEAGVLLARVTQTKSKGEYRYVGIDAGMNTLIRPALYGAYQEIVNLSRLDQEPDVVANVVGPICESGDILGYNRMLVDPQEGDVILIGTVGAYGRAMSSSYNMREPAGEYFLSK